MPTFGQSENHAGLQLADILVSGLLSPMASAVYLQNLLPNNVHAQGSGLEIREQFGSRLRALQHLYINGDRTNGGIVVSDPNTKRSVKHLFKQY